MGTVGEMVEVALAKRFEEDMEQTYCDIPELRSARNVMRNLGIWDAEVLECVAEVDEYNREVLSFLEGQPFARLHIDPYGATRKPVRVIVLKGE